MGSLPHRFGTPLNSPVLPFAPPQFSLAWRREEQAGRPRSAPASVCCCSRAFGSSSSSSSRRASGGEGHDPTVVDRSAFAPLGGTFFPSRLPEIYSLPCVAARRVDINACEVLLGSGACGGDAGARLSRLRAAPSRSLFSGFPPFFDDEKPKLKQPAVYLFSPPSNYKKKWCSSGSGKGKLRDNTQRDDQRYFPSGKTSTAALARRSRKKKTTTREVEEVEGGREAVSGT